MEASERTLCAEHPDTLTSVKNLRQPARLLTEADVSEHRSVKSCSPGSLASTVLSQQSGGQDSEQTLRVLGEPHSSALAGGFPADSISSVGCNVVGILRVDQQRNAERCTWIHSVHILFTIKRRISFHHVSKIVVQKFCLVCPLVGRFWKGCKHHAPTRRLHFLLPFVMRPIPLQLLSQGPRCS